MVVQNGLLTEVFCSAYSHSEWTQWGSAWSGVLARWLSAGLGQR